MSEARFLKIDEDGYFILNEGVRLEDETLGQHWMTALITQDFKTTAVIDGHPIVIEAFDEPLVIRHVEALASEVADPQIQLIAPYGYKTLANLESLCLDEWDRLHGLSDNGVPFVLSRQAQFEFFEQLDDYDDESIVWKGKRLATPAWLNPEAFAPVEQFWSERYQKSETPWDMEGANPALKSILPQLKLAKQKVLVPGCGRGHDAALLAEQGHIVTAVDFSSDAIAEAKRIYGGIANLTFVQADIFEFVKLHAGTFDLIFEHTLYCAIDPALRNSLVTAWKKALQPRGQILAIFFAISKRTGPPFGGSEWELRARLKKDFHFIYWTRWQHSVERRQGMELMVLAQRLNR